MISNQHKHKPESQFAHEQTPSQDFSFHILNQSPNSSKIQEQSEFQVKVMTQTALGESLTCHHNWIKATSESTDQDHNLTSKLTSKWERNNSRLPKWLRCISSQLCQDTEQMLKFTDCQMESLESNCKDRQAQIWISTKTTKTKKAKESGTEKAQGPAKGILEKLEESKQLLKSGKTLFETGKFKESMRDQAMARTALDQFSWFQLEQLKEEDEQTHSSVLVEQKHLLEFAHFMNIYVFFFLKFKNQVERKARSAFSYSITQSKFKGYSWVEGIHEVFSAEKEVEEMLEFCTMQCNKDITKLHDGMIKNLPDNFKFISKVSSQLIKAMKICVEYQSIPQSFLVSYDEWQAEKQQNAPTEFKVIDEQIAQFRKEFQEMFSWKQQLLDKVSQYFCSENFNPEDIKSFMIEVPKVDDSILQIKSEKTLVTPSRNEEEGVVEEETNIWGPSEEDIQRELNKTDQTGVEFESAEKHSLKPSKDKRECDKNEILIETIEDISSKDIDNLVDKISSLQKGFKTVQESDNESDATYEQSEDEDKQEQESLKPLSKI